MHTVANRITFARIIFIPVFIVLLLGQWPYKQWLAAATFALIAISDGLDGYLARSLNQVSDFGKILDPLADKLVIIAALVTLIQVTHLPVWVVVVIVSRELLVSWLRWLAARKKVVISASPLGKAKTSFQITAVFFWIFNSQEAYGLIVLNPSLINILSWLFITVAIALSIVSALDYFARFRKIWALKP
jgi:CDP-diacylglycerol--glycerol-3-phosphate 3-phosphatidyltransferase